jgi:hypothetical protein
MEAVAGVVADGTTTTGTTGIPSMTTTTMTTRTGTAVFPTPTTALMTTTTTTTTGLTTGLTATWKVLLATCPVADTTRTSGKTTKGRQRWG